MRVRGKGAVIIGHNEEGEEVRSPPAPYIEISDAEAHVLIGLGVAEAFDPVEREALAEAPAPVAVAPEPEPEVTDEAPAADEEAEEELAEEVAEEVAEVAEEVAEEAAEEVAEVAEEVAEEVIQQEPTPAEARATEINDAIDILDAEHFVKTGPRAGHPKVDALKAVLGNAYDDLTAAEVDTVFAKRSAE